MMLMATASFFPSKISIFYGTLCKCLYPHQHTYLIKNEIVMFIYKTKIRHIVIVCEDTNFGGG
jgi:hypothetical protein